MTEVRSIVVRSIFLISVALGGVTAAQAAPSIWWDHIERAQAEDQAACIQNASSLLMKETSHHVTIDADSVRSWSEQTIAIVECIRIEDRLVAAILVSGSDPLEGSHLFNALREGLRGTS